MANSWINGLKRYNSGKGTWCIPKKGTPEYYEVLSMGKKKDAELTHGRHGTFLKEASKQSKRELQKMSREIRSMLKGGTKKEHEAWAKEEKKLAPIRKAKEQEYQKKQQEAYNKLTKKEQESQDYLDKKIKEGKIYKKKKSPFIL